MARDNCSVILNETKLQVDRDICPDISKIVSVRKEDEEVEVRFNYQLNNKNTSGLGKNTRDKWYQLAKLLKNSLLYKPLPLEKTKTEAYGNLRKVIDLKTPTPSYTQIKKRVKLVDIIKFKVDNISHVVRLVKSTEKNTNTEPTGNPDFIRIRTRISFLAVDGTHRFDLTYTDAPSYEVEIEYLTPVDLVAFFNPVKLVVYIIKGEKELISTDEHGQAIQFYNNLLGKNAKFDPTKIYKKVLPQPLNFKRYHVSKMAAYAVTNKLNGSRMIGIVVYGALYGINMVSEVIKIADGLPDGLNKSIFDGEYFQNKYYAFDMLVDSGKDIRENNLDIRLQRMNAAIKIINNPRVIAKTFYLSGDLKADTEKVLAYIHTLNEDDNDGIIYTPITEPYNNRHIYKWKPPSMLTIDFMASKIDPTHYTLQVVGKKGNLVPFAPPGFQGVVESKEELNGVGEYHWVNNTFELVRDRQDKDAPNFIDIAQDVWEDIRNPILEENLANLFGKDEEEERDALRKYHNSIKRDLIGRYFQSGEFRNGLRILDLGAGKGGDLAKYQAARIKKLYAVEPNQAFINELISRSETMAKKFQLGFKVEPIVAYAQETDKITSALRGEKVGGAAMFFALTFFFENEAVLDGLIKTLATNVGKDGFFIGTTMDGQATRELLSDKSSIQAGPVKIVKEYDEFKDFINYGKKITYQYQTSETVATQQTEYLVDWSIFVRKMGEYGFKLLESNMIPTAAWLSEDENQVSRLYREFAFQRTAIKEPVIIKAKEKKHLPIAAQGKTFIFKSVLVDQLKAQDLNYKLVRTGTFADGDCFFHAVLTAIDPVYRKLSADKKKAGVRKFRKELVITEEEWENLMNGNVARIGQAEYSGFDSLLYNNLTGDVSIYLGQVTIIKEVLGKYGMTNFLKKLNSQSLSRLKVSPFIQKIKDIFPEFIYKQQYLTGDKYKPDTTLLEQKTKEAVEQLDAMLTRVKKEAFDAYVKAVTTCGKWVGQDVLELVGNRVDKDIYILEDTEGAPYPTQCAHTNNRTSIIILFQGENHYETIGRQLNTEKVEIQREFEPTDPLIQLIRNEIC